MRAPRRKPDYEADSVEMTADSIKDKGHFHGRKTHGRNRAVAKGDIEVTVREQHPGKAADEGRRPLAGTVLEGPGKDAEITVEARRINKVRPAEGGRESTTASGGAEIFGRLRRRKQ